MPSKVKPKSGHQTNGPSNSLLIWHSFKTYNSPKLGPPTTSWSGSWFLKFTISLGEVKWKNENRLEFNVIWDSHIATGPKWVFFFFTHSSLLPAQNPQKWLQMTLTGETCWMTVDCHYRIEKYNSFGLDIYIKNATEFDSNGLPGHYFIIYNKTSSSSSS